MKVEINTQEKIIKLTETVNLGELFTFLEEILPDLKWREYSIEVNVVNNWQNPIVPFTPYTPITPPNIPFNPINPFGPFYITSSTDGNK